MCPHLYLKSQTEETPEMAKRLSNIPFSSLSDVLNFLSKKFNKILYSSAQAYEHSWVISHKKIKKNKNKKN